MAQYEPSGTNRRRFSLTWDYRGRFARHLSDHVVAGLVDGAAWDVEFWPFSVEQTRRGDAQTTIWDDPGSSVSFLAMQVGLVVRDRFPELFLPVHAALFAARHDEGLDLRHDDVVRQVLVRNGVDADAVFREVASGAALETYRREHQRAVSEYGVFGVPTVIAGGRAVFVRLMHGPAGRPGSARDTVENLLDLVLGWPELNELKHTTIPRPLGDVPDSSDRRDGERAIVDGQLRSASTAHAWPRPARPTTTLRSDRTS